MSRKRERDSAKKSGLSDGDDRKVRDSDAKKGPVRPGDIPKKLRELAEKYGSEFGNLVEELTTSEYRTPDYVEVLQPPAHETEEEARNRRDRNRLYMSKNIERDEMRRRLINVVKQILPEYAVKWIRRNHPEYEDMANLNAYCIILPQALLNEDGISEQAKRAEVEKQRSNNRKWKIRTKQQLGDAVQRMEDLVTNANAMGIEITDEDILYDMMYKLDGPLAFLRVNFENDMKNFKKKSEGVVGNPLATLRRTTIGHLPTDLETFEDYVRSASVVQDTNEIRNYQSSFATMSNKSSKSKKEDSSTSSTTSTTSTSTGGGKHRADYDTWVKDKKCDLCHAKGHIVKSCPKLVAAQEAIGTK